MLLRPTRAALEDLGLSTSVARLGLEELKQLHPVLRAFVERRSQTPRGQETTRLPSTRAVAYNLHSGTARGLTWHEKEDDLDVVWLLGVAWHVGDGNSDAYDVLKTRDANGTLFPTSLDYASLEPDPVEFVTEASRQLPEMLARSRLAPDHEIEDKVCGVLQVSVLTREVNMGGVTLKETWVAVRLPPNAGLLLPPDLVSFVLAALFPTCEPTDLRWEATFPGRTDGDPTEVVYSFMPFPSN